MEKLKEDTYTTARLRSTPNKWSFPVKIVPSQIEPQLAKSSLLGTKWKPRYNRLFDRWLDFKTGQGDSHRETIICDGLIIFLHIP